MTEPYSPDTTSAEAHPDNTSDGNLSKHWVVQDKKRILHKKGSANNQEPYNEVVATALHQRMLQADDEYVRYHLIKDADTAQCACEDFLTDEEEFIPAIYIDRLLPERNDANRFQHYVHCCNRLDASDIELALYKTIVCDDIIANSNRHYRNFGIIRNVETLACRPAPLFDSGSCL